LYIPYASCGSIDEREAVETEEKALLVMHSAAASIAITFTLDVGPMVRKKLLKVRTRVLILLWIVSTAACDESKETGRFQT
jgi:hypothetical protein